MWAVRKILWIPYNHYMINTEVRYIRLPASHLHYNWQKLFVHIVCSLSDWKQPVGRPSHTWLHAFEADLKPLNTFRLHERMQQPFRRNGDLWWTRQCLRRQCCEKKKKKKKHCQTDELPPTWQTLLSVQNLLTSSDLCTTRWLMCIPGERPYLCIKCMKSFVSSGVLKAHIRTHAGVKEYICGCCNMMFTTNGSMKRHMTTHSEVHSFHCQITIQLIGFA